MAAIVACKMEDEQENSIDPRATTGAEISSLVEIVPKLEFDVPMWLDLANEPSRRDSNGWFEQQHPLHERQNGAVPIPRALVDLNVFTEDEDHGEANEEEEYDEEEEKEEEVKIGKPSKPGKVSVHSLERIHGASKKSTGSYKSPRTPVASQRVLKPALPTSPAPTAPRRILPVRKTRLSHEITAPEPSTRRRTAIVHVTTTPVESKMTTRQLQKSEQEILKLLAIQRARQKAASSSAKTAAAAKAETSKPTLISTTIKPVTTISKRKQQAQLDDIKNLLAGHNAKLKHR